MPISQAFIDDVVRQFGRTSGLAHQTVTVETPNSLLQIIATSAPFAVIQMFFAVLVIFFFLSGWTRMRKRTIVGRASFDGAMTTARVIQQVVDATSTYLGTITMVNIGMGAVVALILWLIGHGIAADVGRHRRGAQLHSLSRPDRLGAAARARRADGSSPIPGTRCCRRSPSSAVHLVEANIVTPTVVGRRLTINPLMILLA